MRSFFIFFLTFYLYFFNAQSGAYEFLGTLQLSDKNMITYKLNFTLADKGNFTGETVTDFSGEHRTVTKVVGDFNKKNKTISFSETKNISTKSNYENANFCYVNVNNASIKLKNNKSIIHGTFVGKYENGKKCADGNIFLIGSEQLYKKLNEVSKKVNKIKPLDEKAKEGLDTAAIAKEANNNILKSDDKLKINWSADKVVFDVWDTQTEDGDKISIYVNGNLFQKNIFVKNNKQTFTIPFEGNDLTISIVAENEGVLPSNTAQILLRDSKENFPVITGLKKGEKVTIILKKN